MGSPPRMWGIPATISELVRWLRITPTYVGNTHIKPIKLSGDEDHPPRMWGILMWKSEQIFNDRITPTYVGNT
ncbi:hypothetical protein D271_05500 [Ligilactobacillus saerimneri 30a]|uniref:Uncharacterized protein n=1 Tax=Ligilactobacillus saerimneri 30a TaxID=1227363 RepID=M5J470_9LACO|nr:hypothetical protein D271_05500 [Ligilactobacillus saerimneri 30a]